MRRLRFSVGRVVQVDPKYAPPPWAATDVRREEPVTIIIIIIIIIELVHAAKSLETGQNRDEYMQMQMPVIRISYR